MKHCIEFNQIGIVKAGLIGITDLSDWAIIDYIKELLTYPESNKLTQNNQLYVQLNYTTLMKELPMLHITTKDPITNRLKKLKKLRLIDTFILKNNTLHVRLTDECMDVLSYSRC